MEWNRGENLEDATHKHVRTCTYIATHLDLAVLVLELYTTRAIARQIAASGKDMP
jgi:hypothetical protein